MVRAGYIDAWNDREIFPGQEWNSQIKKELDEADIILFLVSSDFIASDFIHDTEIATAIKKQQAGETIIVPIIIRPCDFQSLPLKNYQALPQGAKAISIWENQDSAWLDVRQALKRVISSVYKRETAKTVRSNRSYSAGKKRKGALSDSKGDAKRQRKQVPGEYCFYRGTGQKHVEKHGGYHDSGHSYFGFYGSGTT